MFKTLSPEANSIGPDSANIEAESRDSEYLNFTPLFYAVKFGHDKVIEVLLKYGAKLNSPNKDGDTPLHIAAKDYYDEDLFKIETVELLLKKGAIFDVFNDNGDTPLDLAIKNDNCWSFHPKRK
jgi:hypothetical protein